jgi:hypothetical protein
MKNLGSRVRLIYQDGWSPTYAKFANFQAKVVTEA